MPGQQQQRRAWRSDELDPDSPACRQPSPSNGVPTATVPWPVARTLPATANPDGRTVGQTAAITDGSGQPFNADNRGRTADEQRTAILYEQRTGQQRTAASTDNLEPWTALANPDEGVDSGRRTDVDLYPYPYRTTPRRFHATLGRQPCNPNCRTDNSGRWRTSGRTGRTTGMAMADSRTDSSNLAADSRSGQPADPDDGSERPSVGQQRRTRTTGRTAATALYSQRAADGYPALLWL